MWEVWDQSDKKVAGNGRRHVTPVESLPHYGRKQGGTEERIRPLYEYSGIGIFIQGFFYVRGFQRAEMICGGGFHRTGENADGEFHRTGRPAVGISSDREIGGGNFIGQRRSPAGIRTPPHTTAGKENRICIKTGKGNVK